MQPDSILPGAVKTEEQHRRDICTVGHWMYERGYVASTDGNISVRLGPDRILTSPTCLSKGMMTSDDLVITDLEGRRVDGTRKPSSEMGMHVLIYRLRPDVNAVCHAHPPVATGFAAAGLALDKPILCELVLDLGGVPLARYGTPGTAELTAAVEPFIRDHNAILMANHGVVTYGADLLTAFQRMECTEHSAKVALVTELLGKQVVLSGGDVEKLVEARARYQSGAQVPAAESKASAPLPNDATDRVTLTRRELEALIDEAIEKDRSRH